MAKHPRVPSLAQIARFEHWRVSAGLAVVFAVVAVSLLPLLKSSNIPWVKTFGLAAEPIAYILAGTFAFIAVLNRQMRRSPRRKYSMAGSGNFRAMQAMDRTWRAPAISRTVKLLYERPSVWSQEVLQSLEWKRFEGLCMAYFEEKGHKVECLLVDTEGRTVIKVQQGVAVPYLVQCVTWSGNAVSVVAMHQFCEVLNHRKVAKGFFIAAGGFSAEARVLANTSGITLITGDMLLMMLQRLPRAAQIRLLTLAAAGDYTTPTCPACNIKMTRRKSRHGEFWRCRNFPHCRKKLYAASVSMQVHA